MKLPNKLPILACAEKIETQFSVLLLSVAHRGFSTGGSYRNLKDQAKLGSFVTNVIIKHLLYHAC